MDGTESVTRVTLFGAPEIRRGVVPVAVDTRKAIALLAYLAITGRPATRDKLCAMFWPESTQARARSALRRTLSSLRLADARHALPRPVGTHQHATYARYVRAERSGARTFADGGRRLM